MSKHFWLVVVLLVSSDLVAQSIPKLPVKQDPRPVAKPVKVVPSTQTVKFLSDAYGELYIDGDYQGSLEPDRPLRLKLRKGDYALRVESTEEKNAVLRETLTVSSTDAEMLYTIRLAAEIKSKAENPSILYAQGMDYLNGSKVVKDVNKAIQLFEKAAGLGNAIAMRQLGILYSNNPSLKNETKAMEWFLKGANAADDVSLNWAGFNYLNGKGVEVNLQRAFDYFQKAAEKNNYSAMTNLAHMYDYGKGTTQDYAKAAGLYKKGADGGVKEAMNNLGIMYFYGKHFTKNYTAAIEWFLKGAAAGEIYSMNWMGYMYEYGYGVTANSFTAKEWYKKSCDAGNSDACDRYKKLN